MDCKAVAHRWGGWCQKVVDANPDDAESVMKGSVLFLKGIQPMEEAESIGQVFRALRVLMEDNDFNNIVNELDSPLLNTLMKATEGALNPPNSAFFLSHVKCPEARTFLLTRGPPPRKPRVISVTDTPSPPRKPRVISVAHAPPPSHVIAVSLESERLLNQFQKSRRSWMSSKRELPNDAIVRAIRLNDLLSVNDILYASKGKLEWPIEDLVNEALFEGHVHIVERLLKECKEFDPTWIQIARLHSKNPNMEELLLNLLEAYAL